MPSGVSYALTFHAITTQGKTLNRSGILNCTSLLAGGAVS